MISGICKMLFEKIEIMFFHAISLKKIIDLMDSNLNYNLIFIKSNFRALINVILRFEELSSSQSAPITVVLDTQN